MNQGGGEIHRQIIFRRITSKRGVDKSRLACYNQSTKTKGVSTLARLEREMAIHLLSEAIDILCGLFGAEWCVRWGIDHGLSDEEICDWLYEDMETVIKVRKEIEKD